MKRVIFILSFCLYVLILKGQIDVVDQNYCGPAQVDFFSNSTSCPSYEWYSRTGALLGSGCNFKTPLIAFDKSFYVVDKSSVTIERYGYQANNTALSGFVNTANANVTNKYATDFTVKDAFVFKSVEIRYDQQLASGVEIELRITDKSTNSIVFSKKVLLQQGNSVMAEQINIDQLLSVGDYQIQLLDVVPNSALAQGDVWVHTNGADYSTGGHLDYAPLFITGNGLGNSSWGGLYNWSIEYFDVKLIRATDDCVASLCESSGLSQPLINLDFGSGNTNPGAALTPGITTYRYEANVMYAGSNWMNGINDGEYSIVNSACIGSPGGWHCGQDHTPNDNNGYMMLVNADASPGVFYKQRLTGLCDNNYYNFSAWYANVLSPSSVCGTSGLPVNLKFTIKDENGVILAESTTGNQGLNSSLTWKNFTLKFFLSSGVRNIDLILSNVGPGGCGNDVAIDDITFTPCSGNISISSDKKFPLCPKDSVLLSSNISPILTGANLQWEKSIDNGLNWSEIAGEENLNLKISSLIDKAQYRVKAKISAGVNSCPVVSNVITIDLQNCDCHQTFSISGDTAICPDGKALLKILYEGTPIPTGSLFSVDLYQNNNFVKSLYSSNNLTALADVNVGGTYTIKNIQSTCPADSITIANTMAIVDYHPIPVKPSIIGVDNSCRFQNQQYKVLDSTFVTDWSIDGDADLFTSADKKGSVIVWVHQSEIKLKAKQYNVLGCSNESEKTLSIYPYPAPPVGVDKHYCFNDVASTLNVVGTNLEYYENLNGVWKKLPSAPIPNTSIVDTLNYKVVQKDNNNCVSDSINLNVFVHDIPPLFIESEDTLCKNESAVNLLVNISGGTFSGQGVEGGMFDPSKSGVIENGQNKIFYSYTSTFGCYNEVSKDIFVRSVPNPVELIIQDTLICEGDQTVLKMIGYDPAYHYEWYHDNEKFADDIVEIKVLQKGLYEVKISDTYCSNFSSSVNLNTQQVFIEPINDIEVEEGSSVYLNANYEITPIDSYYSQWSYRYRDEFISTESNLTILPLEDTTLIFQIKTKEGCIAEEMVHINVVKELLVPHIYSPNNDGLNDTWIIQNISDFPEARIKVYNRWGSLVFDKTNYLNDWSGIGFNGGSLPVATYYYVIDRSAYGKSTLTGSVSIVR